MITAKIDLEVAAELQRCSYDGNTLRMAQMDRKLYERVNKILVLLGGKWNRGQKAHIFDDDAAEIVTEALMAGEVIDRKKTFQFFPTPPTLCAQMVEMLNVSNDTTILEPSAGSGAILTAVYAALPQHKNVTAIELDVLHECELLPFQQLHGTVLVWDNFLKCVNKADRIVMNPPFTKGQDITHVRHAYECLNADGRIIAITSPGWLFRQDKAHKEFRQWFESLDAMSEPLEGGSFASSGTMVNALLLWIDK
jgi:type I restriction-modification system DNA methylase subunit